MAPQQPSWKQEARQEPPPPEADKKPEPEADKK
jgi:hypothetical protein